MTLNKIILSDDIRLSYIHTNKFKTGVITFSLTAPLDKRGYLCSLVLSGMMRRGSESFPSMRALNRRLDDLYASTVDVQTTIYADTLALTVSAELIDKRYSIDGTDVAQGVIELIADILLRPLLDGGVFPADTVASERTFAKDALAAEINNTRSYAMTRLKELMSRGNDSYPTLEYLLSGIDSVSAEELTKYYKALISTAPLSVFYVGGEDADDIGQKVLTSFASYRATKRYSPLIIARNAPREPMTLTEDMPVSQGKLAMGFRTGAGFGSGEHATAIMLNEILGASPASKLFMNVRERLGLCYYCSSSFSIFSGELAVSSGIDVANRERATEEILRQLDAIRRGDISDAEFFAARKSLEYTYMQIYDSPFALWSFYTGRDIAGIDESVEDFKERLMSVTPDEVAALAKRTVYDTCFFINGTLSAEGGEDDE